VLRTDFDRIIAMCKNWQDEHKEFSSHKMDTVVTIQTLETTYKSSIVAVALEAMLAKLADKLGPMVKRSGHVNSYERVLLLTQRSFLNM